MKIFFDANAIGPWVAERTGGTWTPGRGTAIGLMDDNNEIIAGVLYEDFNGTNVIAHISGSRNWATSRKFLWMIFDYPFNQLKVKRITALVASGNHRSQQTLDRLGFQFEFEFEDGHPDGALFAYKMNRAQCRWLDILEHNHG